MPFTDRQQRRGREEEGRRERERMLLRRQILYSAVCAAYSASAWIWGYVKTGTGGYCIGYRLPV